MTEKEAKGEIDLIFYKLFFEAARDGIVVADTKTKKFVLANPRACELTGYSLKELTQRSIMDIHPKKDLPHVVAEFEKQLKRKVSLSRNLPVLRKDGIIIYCDFNSAPVQLDDKQLLAGFFRDVTELKKKTEELEESESRYRLLTQQTGSLVYDYDVQSGSIKWIGEAKEITGYSEEEFQKVSIRQWEGMVHPEDRKQALSLLAKAEKAVGKYKVEYQFKQKDGSYKYIRDEGSFLPDNKGNALRMLGVMNDIGDTKEYQAELEDKNAELERFNKLAVGRELRMTELKRRIKDLEQREANKK